MTRPYDDVVYVGGDTQGVMNIEYRIPIIGQVFTMAPFFDIGKCLGSQQGPIDAAGFEQRRTVSRRSREISAGNELRCPDAARVLSFRL